MFLCSASGSRSFSYKALSLPFVVLEALSKCESNRWQGCGVHDLCVKRQDFASVKCLDYRPRSEASGRYA